MTINKSMLAVLCLWWVWTITDVALSSKNAIGAMMVLVFVELTIYFAWKVGKEDRRE